jgi:hypothetical protein
VDDHPLRLLHHRYGLILVDDLELARRGEGLLLATFLADPDQDAPVNRLRGPPLHPVVEGDQALADQALDLGSGQPQAAHQKDVEA